MNGDSEQNPEQVPAGIAKLLIYCVTPSGLRLAMHLFSIIIPSLPTGRRPESHFFPYCNFSINIQIRWICIL